MLKSIKALIHKSVHLDVALFFHRYGDKELLTVAGVMDGMDVNNLSRRDLRKLATLCGLTVEQFKDEYCVVC